MQYGRTNERDDRQQCERGGDADAELRGGCDRVEGHGMGARGSYGRVITPRLGQRTQVAGDASFASHNAWVGGTTNKSTAVLFPVPELNENIVHFSCAPMKVLALLTSMHETLSKGLLDALDAPEETGGRPT
jgi:hypothetical protein